MKSLLKQLIIDFHSDNLPDVFPRAFTLQTLPKNIRKSYVFMGMRRSGKTWLMYQKILEIMQEHPIEKILYINFEDDRLLSFKAENFQDILIAYFDLYPQYAHSEEIAFFFDEIHRIEGWEKFIRRLLDKEKMALYITGSSAKMLSKEIATSLRGRAIEMEIFPFSLQEYLQFHQVDFEGPLSYKSQSQIRNYAQSYLKAGGFPETLFLEKEVHRELLQGYVNSVVFRDVIDRYSITNSHAVKLFLLHCLQNISSPLSITKIYNSLKSNGTSVSKNSLYEYLEYFEDAYLLFTVTLYDLSLRKRQVNPKKIYTIDPGVLTAYSTSPHFDHGPVLENAVFLQLRRRHPEIFYYKTITQKEIDFVILDSIGELHLYQCCLSMENEKTMHRETSALYEAAKELNTKHLYIITLDEEGEYNQQDFLIKMIPYWKWAIAPLP